MRARATIQRVLGLLLTMFSTAMLLPIVVSVIFGDGQWLAFAASFLIILGSGILIWWPVREQTHELRLREGFLVVAAFWIVLGLFGSVPLLLTGNPQMSLTDAVFESMSGLTTTGATVLTGLAELPESILFYRHQLQWFGGLGIIVLAVAVLPMLGVGGMQLYRAETPGPVKDTRLTPRITETAKALWYVYLGITVLCALAYLLAGMGPVRRHLPRLQHRRHRRFLDIRRELRALRQRCDRTGRGRVHVRRRHQFLAALPRLAASVRQALPAGPGVSRLLETARWADRGGGRVPAFPGVLSDAHGDAHPRPVPDRFHRHHHRIHHGRFRRVARRAAGAADLFELSSADAPARRPAA